MTEFVDPFADQDHLDAELDKILDEMEKRSAEETEIATTLRLNRSLHRRVRVAAAREGKPMAQWIREALDLVATRMEEKRRAR